MGRNSIYQAGHQASNSQRAKQTHAYSSQSDAHAFTHNQSEHATGLRAERHAQSDLSGALSYGVREHGVNSNRRNQQRHAGK
jgi:hypothetical protein